LELVPVEGLSEEDVVTDGGGEEPGRLRHEPKPPLNPDSPTQRWQLPDECVEEGALGKERSGQLGSRVGGMGWG
jgi:hypothetical protein